VGTWSTVPTLTRKTSNNLNQVFEDNYEPPPLAQFDIHASRRKPKCTNGLLPGVKFRKLAKSNADWSTRAYVIIVCKNIVNYNFENGFWKFSMK
jgi:hypothetical protein